MKKILYPRINAFPFSNLLAVLINIAIAYLVYMVTRVAFVLENWSLYRLGSVERAALRLGAWELLNCRDIAAPVVMNEAVDLVKYFSESRSGRFVNGILDRFAKNLPAPAPKENETLSVGV